MGRKKGMPVSEKQSTASRININKAREKRLSEIEKQRELREKFGISSSDESETDQESSDEDTVVFVASKKKKKALEKAPELPDVSDIGPLQELKNEMREMKLLLEGKRKKRASPIKKKKVTPIKSDPEREPEIKTVEEPIKEPRKSINLEPIKEIETDKPLSKVESIMKRSSSNSSLNKETNAEKIERLTNKFRNLNK